MLNELIILARSMGEMGIDSKRWNNQYYPLAEISNKKPCVKIWIDPNGSVGDLGLIESRDDAVELRKYGRQGNSFPGFNILPLFSTSGKGTNGEYILGSDLWNKTEYDNLSKCICTKAQELKRLVSAHGNNESNALTKLLDAISIYDGNDGAKRFRDSLQTTALRLLNEGNGISQQAAKIIVFGSNGKNAQKIQVFFDYAKWHDLGYPVASSHITSWLNDVLNRSVDLGNVTSDAPIADSKCLDAYGSDLPPIEEKMPEVNLKGLGTVKLRAMFKEQHCQKRYGKIEDGSFPISRRNRESAKQALEYISAPDKMNVTWKSADKDVIFVYPSKLCETKVPYINLIARCDSTELKEKRFEKAAEEFIKVFDALESKQKPDNIIIFALKKIDKSRTKVVLTRSLTAEDMIRRAKDWQEGCDNFPEMDFDTSKNTPYPFEVYEVFNKVWGFHIGDKAGTCYSTSNVKRNCGIELFLNAYEPTTTKHLLHMLLKNTEGLFAFVSNSHRRSNIQTTVLASISRTCAVIGLLLFKITGKKEEKALKKTPYIVGQMLKIADELHIMYCQNKRNGDIPPQLVGNSFFLTASETPAKALDRLAQRMLPYISWAKQYSATDTNKDNWRARWLFTLFEKYAPVVSDELAQNKTLRFGDVERAQVFLGYLAKLPKIKEDDADPSAQDN